MKVEDSVYFRGKRMSKVGIISIMLLCVFVALTSCVNSSNNVKDESNMDYGAYDYWKEIMSKDEKEFMYLVQWIEENNNFTYLSISENNTPKVYVEPSGQKTKTVLESAKGFDRVKDFLLKEQIDIINNWRSKNRIVFSHRFFAEDLSGNYCLTYTEKGIEEEPQYKPVDNNFYSHVTFYE